MVEHQNHPKAQAQQQQGTSRHRRRGRKGENGSAQQHQQPTTHNNSGIGSSVSSSGTGTGSTRIQPHTSLLINPLLDDGELWYTTLSLPATAASTTSTTTSSTNNNKNHTSFQQLQERNAVIVLSSKQSSLQETAATANDATKNKNKKNQHHQQLQTIPNPVDIVIKYRTDADQIYKNEVTLYNTSKKNILSVDDQWVENTIRKGTMKDRIAAMSVILSHPNHPIHKLHILDQLLSFAGCYYPNSTANNNHSNSNSNSTNSRIVQMAAEALEDLFIHTLLPSDRKLISLVHRPLLLYENNNITITNTNNNTNTKRTLSPRILLIWRFEEMIKERYDWFLKYYITRTLNDTLSNTVTTSSSSNATNTNATAGNNSNNMDGPKIAALRTASALLRSVPEGEAYILPIIVNKLGDPKPTICAATSYELRKVLHTHPVMIHIIAREVQQLIFRPHLSIHAIYNCITFLNQLKLTRPTTTSTKDVNNDSKQIRNEEPSLAVSLMNTYFRLFDVAIQQQQPQQSKHKVNHKKDADNNNNSTMNQSRLLSALLTGVNRAHPYLPKEGSSSNSFSLIDNHIDALYRVVHTAPPTARTQSLLLLYHISVGSGNSNKNTNDESTSRRDRFYRALYATLGEPTMIGTGKHLTMYYNLLYRAMKYDTDMSRVVAFTKKLFSTALHCTSAVLTASLFLIDTIAQDYHPSLYTCYNDIFSGQDALRMLDPTKREPRGALVALKNDDNKSVVDNDSDDSDVLAPGWELSLSTYHYHPSVQKFCNTLGNGSGISRNYTGDPLRDFSLAPFLDKFAYRNPKSMDRKVTPVAGDEPDAVIDSKFSHSIGARRNQVEYTKQPLNDPKFVESTTVNEDETFFHTFFVERAKRDAIKGIVRNKNQSTNNDMDDEVAEMEALGRAEERNADQTTTSKYEFDDDWDQWDTDDEEEAFVDSLAQQIIDDAMEQNPVDDLDDEDPDTEGWDDLHDDVEEDKIKQYGDDDDEDEDGGDHNDEDSGDDYDFPNEEDDDLDAMDDNDAFMDQVSDDSGSANADIDFDDDDSHDADKDIHIEEEDGEEDEDAEGDDGEEEDKSENDDIDEDIADMIRDEEEDDENDVDDEDDEEVPTLLKVSSRFSKDHDSLYAPAEDYAEMVEKSWNALKRGYTNDDVDDNDDEKVQPDKTGQKLDTSYSEDTKTSKKSKKRRIRRQTT